MDLGYTAGILAPADNGTFSVTFGVFGRDPVLGPLRRPSAFQAAASSVPGLARWVAPEVSASLEGAIRFLGNLPNHVRRLSVDGQPLATGVVTVGDSAVCTNPRFGRGISLALVQAAALAHLLETQEGPRALAAAFAHVTAQELEPWYHDAVASDRLRARVSERVRGGEPLSAIGGPAGDAPTRFAMAVPYAAQRDPVVRTPFQRTWHLLDPPAAFSHNPEVRARVEAVWRDLQRERPPPQGRTYAEMGRVLSGAA